jgi:hypothetical protein
VSLIGVVLILRSAFSAFFAGNNLNQHKNPFSFFEAFSFFEVFEIRNVEQAVGLSCIIFTAGVLFITTYALDFYPKIPQALGGASPRCAYLEGDTSKISSKLKTELFGVKGEESGVMRSPKVDIYHAGDNWLLVKRHPTAKTTAPQGTSDSAASGTTTIPGTPSPSPIEGATGKETTQPIPMTGAEPGDSMTYEVDRAVINTIV